VDSLSVKMIARRLGAEGYHNIHLGPDMSGSDELDDYAPLSYRIIPFPVRRFTIYVHINDN
jgi:hypothetical protein